MRSEWASRIQAIRGRAMQIGFIFVALIAASLTIADMLELGSTDLAIPSTIATLLAAVLLMITISKRGPRHSSSRSTRMSDRINTEDLIDSIADGVIMVDKKDHITLFNPAAQDVSGWEQGEAIKLDYHSVLKLTNEKGEELTEAQHPIARCFISGESVKENTAKLVTKSEKSIDVSLIASPIMDGDSVSSVIAVLRDVSQERSQERQRAEFISTASHEMRTPVAAIEGFLALAMNEKVSRIDTNARGYIEKAHSSTKHLGKLFQDLLTAAKSEDGRLTNNPIVFEVGAFLSEFTEGVRFTAEKKGLAVDYQVGGDEIKTASDVLNTVQPIYYIMADPERLREVVTNLFDNAVKYTEEGKITVSLQADDKVVVIGIRDTGAGIPKEDISHLFQKFYRVDNTATRQIGGTGLGLFISRKIIELYNGRIWVESEMGQGSVFYIRLPRLNTVKAQAMMKQQNNGSQPIMTTPKQASGPTAFMAGQAETGPRTTIANSPSMPPMQPSPAQVAQPVQQAPAAQPAVQQPAQTPAAPAQPATPQAAPPESAQAPITLGARSGTRS